MRGTIGIDIGGTSARVGLVADGAILERETLPTGFDTQGPELIARLRAAIARLGEPDAIGVGMPGLQDAQGRVTDASNLPGLNGFAIAQELAATWNCPHRIDNDLNVLALGEQRYGGHNARRLLVVALGTGIGAAAVVDGAVLRPTSGSLGDPGHILVDADGTLCRCGARGCLETKVSGWSIAEHGDKEVPHWLGMGLATYCVLYEPDTIVLGGKISAAGGTPFLAAVEQRMKAVCQPRFHGVSLKLSNLGDDAGILGAAALMS